MDNFRPKKRPGRVASGSIDGFSSANRQPTKRFNRSYLKDRSSSDPSFDRTEGFLTNNQKQNASSFDENIPLENFKEPRPKKRLFRRNKKEQLVKRKQLL